MKPILKLIGVNVLLLFCGGPTMFSDFLQSNIGLKPDIYWTNHSIYSFAQLAKIEPTGLYIVVLVCLGIAYYRGNLLLPLTLGAMLLPSISHDYKLPILAFPLCLTLSRTNQYVGFGLCLLYGLTLFSFVTKPPWLANNFPVLLCLLILSLFAENHANH